MKKVITLCMCLVWAGMVASAQTAPTLYEVLPDEKDKKVLKGFITPALLSADPDFGWYAETLQFFKPNKEAVATLAAKGYEVQLVLFLGTWCPDSHQLVPKYLATLEAAQFPMHHLTLIAVDRQKQALANLHKPLGIINVPTMLVYQNGKELGRIVEFGNGERVDKQLAAILANVTVK